MDILGNDLASKKDLLLRTTAHVICISCGWASCLYSIKDVTCLTSILFPLSDWNHGKSHWNRFRHTAYASFRNDTCSHVQQHSAVITWHAPKKSSLLLRCLLYGDFQTFLKHSWASLCGSNHVKLSVKLGPPRAFCKASPKRCPNLLQSTWRKQMKARIQPFRI